MSKAVRLEHAPIAEQGREDPGQAAREGDGGNGLAATGRDAEGPGPQGFGLRRPTAEDGDGGLNQEPAHAGVAGLGDPPLELTDLGNTDPVRSLAKQGTRTAPNPVL